MHMCDSMCECFRIYDVQYARQVLLHIDSLISGSFKGMGLGNAAAHSVRAIAFKILFIYVRVVFHKCLFVRVYQCLYVCILCTVSQKYLG